MARRHASSDKGAAARGGRGLRHANEAAWRVADNGVQLLGGAGYVKDYPVEKWLRDTKTLALFAPPSEIADAGAGVGASSAHRRRQRAALGGHPAVLHLSEAHHDRLRAHPDSRRR